MTSLPFSSTDSEPGNLPGHSSSLQECQIPKHHRGKVHAAPRPGGLWAEQVSVSVRARGGDRGHRAPGAALGGSLEPAVPGGREGLHWGRHSFGSKPPRPFVC